MTMCGEAAMLDGAELERRWKRLLMIAAVAMACGGKLKSGLGLGL